VGLAIKQSRKARAMARMGKVKISKGEVKA
jgi:hypothetical protein